MLENFEPMVDIPSGAYVTYFDSRVNFKQGLLNDLFQHIDQYGVEVSQAHLLMESNQANGILL
ncbi:hypothetical protein [Neobacillus dielmonensis]|uniref:hypothetical protein n=1 Tax=Neobacillus dielmonensis TaxID=1347369 RepID=UPI000693B4D3|nr:hypothetical protein [Neobacillus dielmonensis]